MGDLRPATRTPGARLALAAVAVALFGLLSMHGWGSHATHSPDAMATGPQGANVMVAAGHDGTVGHAPMTDEGPAGLSAVHQPQAPDGDERGGMIGLCLAVLAGLLFGIALLLARGAIRIPRSLLPSRAHPVFLGRDRDPPGLLRLCVIRC